MVTVPLAATGGLRLAAATTSQITHSLTWPWLVGVGALALLAAIALGVWLGRRPRRGRQSPAAPPAPPAHAAPPETAATEAAAHASPRIAAAGASQPGTVWVANSRRFQDNPALRTWLRRYRLWQWLGIAAACTGLIGAATVAARPVTTEVKQTTLGTRDIVLCLDISGSMLEYDRQVVEVFSSLVKNFDGERIALSVFNETSRTVFPLTNDYQLVSEQLSTAYQALDPSVIDYASPDAVNRYLDFTNGTTLTGTQSSLIGDGLANCAMLFDDSAASGRARSIILATDNDLRGTPVYTLDQALALTSERDIEVSGLYGASSWVQDPSVESSYRTSITNAGGHYYRVDDADAVREIVQRVQDQQAVDLGATPEITESERPWGWIIVTLLGVAILVAAQWRLRE
ncbi:Ca-activated chloride channel family protein [Rarobacter incanus]|uniref:Ca-activated chloride channel family protein n=1 Tax=Rarobacter incanus TaxID=153494 RepID=A0A542SRD8_9MICO|nr:Ca-activated chloride channel family protein [Rarobacter incanus]